MPIEVAMHGLLPRLRAALALGGLLLALAVAAQAAARPDLVIVHTNDLHAHYRSFPDREGALRGGLARIAWRLGELRAEHGERLLYLDAGDLFAGTPFYHFYRGSLGIALMDRLGCDAMALGNHELDDGHLNFLRARVGASFPTLCANLSLPTGELLLPESVLLLAGDLRVEVVGAIAGELPELVGEAARGELLVQPPERVLRDWLAAARPAVDLRLLLSHCGLETDRALAAALPEIPLILGGHSHSFLETPETVGPVTVCQTGCYGYNLGVMECFRRLDGGWDFAWRSEPVTADWPEDPAVKALIEAAGVLVDREMGQVLGILPEAFRGEHKSSAPDPLGIFLAERMRQAAGADLGLQNSGGYRTHLPAGPVTRAQLFELLPFNNRILRLHLKGNDLRTVFDFLAAGHGDYRFAQIAGGDYAIADSLALEIHVGGQPLDPEREYTLATLDFLYSGGDGYGSVLQLADRVDSLAVFGRDVLEAYLKAGGQPRPSDFPPNFRVLD
jgi:5'-nucleotidase/UDP-sugar diphosphatase